MIYYPPRSLVVPDLEFRSSDRQDQSLKIGNLVIRRRKGFIAMGISLDVDANSAEILSTDISNWIRSATRM